MTEQSPEYQVTTYDFQVESAILLSTAIEHVSHSKIPNADIIDFRETLSATKEIFGNPIFFEKTSSLQLVEVAEFL
ncbi:MAG: hypothetical protein O2871_03295, partial [bacterium]|nr:hypothetical protein [bacterium]